MFQSLFGTMVVLTASVAWAALYTPPSNQPVCNGILDSGPGGMFGYSIALSSGEQSNFTWMVRFSGRSLGHPPWLSLTHFPHLM